MRTACYIIPYDTLLYPYESLVAAGLAFGQNCSCVPVEVALEQGRQRRSIQM